MKELLADYYNIQAQENIFMNGREGFKQDNFLYFTISADFKEIIHMEQASAAYFLVENNYTQVAYPIQNLNGDWFTRYYGKHYLVLKAAFAASGHGKSEGKALANLHQAGVEYPFEPREISSYGQWKQLWIDKLTAFENKIKLDAEEVPGEWSQLLADVLPYIIGISENAIQYMQESEGEKRFSEVDQGTIGLRRYSGKIMDGFVWTHELVYDHAARDLAEFIRYSLLQVNDPMKKIRDFLNEYQEERQLSVFSWRLIYARLIFPIHLFDAIEQGYINSGSSASERVREMQDLMERQGDYERRLGKFFDEAGVDCERLQIPVLHWL
ncbi:spore coat-associated protein CotNH [Virgibacillus siamensis]|uniref:Spore coat-associated protein CotNH n=1 Tax=Virgibacillus siamensis TaxID=480071 RepID=A0ABN1FDP0_9BACI